MPLKFTRLVGNDIIPTKVSQLENDSNYQNEEQVDAKVNTITKEKLGLDKVDNTSDMDKPISNATQNALNQKANVNDVYTKEETDNNNEILNEKLKLKANRMDLGDLAFRNMISKSELGLENVNNTSDVNKPISNAMQQALNLKENKENLRALAYKDNITKEDIGLGNVNNVAITEQQVAKISKIEDIEKQAETNKEDIQNVQQISNDALNIAKGKSKAKVFETYEEMTIFLKNTNSNTFSIGDNLYIKDVEVHDFWVSGILYDSLGKYGYYEISPLEGGKVNLLNYYDREEIDEKKEEIDEKIGDINTIIGDYEASSEPTAVPNSGTIEKVYVNTSMSAEEVVSLLNNVATDGFAFIFVNSDMTSALGCLKDNLSGDDPTPYWMISYMKDGNNVNIFEETQGWLLQIKEFEVNTELVSEFNGMPVGNYNDKLTSLFSTTPFSGGPTIAGDIKELQSNVEEIKSSIGDYDVEGITPIPNSGYVENVYFNTSLSVDEVVDIIESANLNFQNQTYYVYIDDTGVNWMRITKYNLENTQQYTIHVRQLPELDHVKLFATNLISLGLYGWDKSYGNKINTGAFFRTYGSKNDALSRIFSITPYGENLTISKDISNLKVSIENINANIDDVNENIKDINANLGDINTILDTLNGEVI